MVKCSGFHCGVRCRAMLPRSLATAVLACHKSTERADETPRSSVLLVTRGHRVADSISRLRWPLSYRVRPATAVRLFVAITDSDW